MFDSASSAGRLIATSLSRGRGSLARGPAAADQVRRPARRVLLERPAFGTTKEPGPDRPRSPSSSDGWNAARSAWRSRPGLMCAPRARPTARLPPPQRTLSVLSHGPTLELGTVPVVTQLIVRLHDDEVEAERQRAATACRPAAGRAREGRSPLDGAARACGRRPSPRAGRSRDAIASAPRRRPAPPAGPGRARRGPARRGRRARASRAPASPTPTRYAATRASASSPARWAAVRMHGTLPAGDHRPLTPLSTTASPRLHRAASPKAR